MNTSRKRIRKYFYIALFVLFFFILYGLSALSGLRFFIPHYFNIAGGPFSEKNYLVIFQNNNELRPTGGFISAYGKVKFKNGLFSDIEVRDVFGDIDEHGYIEAPYPQKELLDGQFYQGYTFRDANYYGDFPTSVEELLKMYKLTDPDTNFDGVIAINIKVLEDFVYILKSVKIDNLEFTASNVFELLEFSLHNIDHHNAEEVSQRKSILGPLAKGIIKKTTFSPLKWREISDMIYANLNEKHIQLYFFNSGLQKAMARKKWDGAWHEPEKDFLAVVEANLAGMKSDRYIKRDVSYRLEIWENPDLNSHTLTATTTLNIEHFGNYNVPISGNYSGYFRIYAPKNSKLKKSNVEVKDESSSDYSVWGTIVRLSPGEKRTIEITYEIPQSVFKDGEYKLDVIKQAGTINDIYSIIVEAPQGLMIESKDFEARENYAIWNNNLIRDVSLSFNVLPDKIGPRVAYSEIQSLDQILVVFNERIDDDFFEILGNVLIEDTDENNPSQSDKIRVKELKVDYRDLIITVEGMTEQPEEFYKLTIKNAFDLHGNSIEPAPKEITLVQRL